MRGCSQSILVKAMFFHFSGTYSRRARSKSKHTTIPRWSSAFSECNFKKQQLTIRAHHFSERVRVPSENKTRLKEGSVLTQKWLPIPLGGQIQAEAEINFRVNLCGTQKQDLPCWGTACSGIFQIAGFTQKTLILSNVVLWMPEEFLHFFACYADLQSDHEREKSAGKRSSPKLC